ncbi:putative glycosyl transferase [mine drainage metagenome]|uniref:Putative glycosyl transferase n=1 Tax=mine drainage metagenome TaxID=410659 RepID=A0A1J5NVM0_9ZZZZ
MQFAGRISNPTMNQAFPLAYEPRKLSEEEELEASVFWRRFDESLFKDRSIVCFFGNLSRRIELKTVVDAASHLESIGQIEIIFVIGGEGECLASLKERASGLNNIIFPGWLNFSTIRYLMQHSTFGVLPYPSSKDFVRSYPNKIGEYLSTGLAVLSSTDGAVASLIEDETCGYRYCPESGKSLAETIMNALGDPVELARRRACSINVFNRRFNADIVYGEYTNYIQELGDQSRKRRPL